MKQEGKLSPLHHLHQGHMEESKRSIPRSEKKPGSLSDWGRTERTTATGPGLQFGRSLHDQSHSHTRPRKPKGINFLRSPLRWQMPSAYEKITNVHSTTSTQHCTGHSSQDSRREKKTKKASRLERKKQNYLFIGDVILCVENPKALTKLWINKFSKAAACNIDFTRINCISVL